MPSTEQKADRLSEAIEALARSTWEVNGRLKGQADWSASFPPDRQTWIDEARRDLDAALPFLAKHYEQKGAEGERRRLLDEDGPILLTIRHEICTEIEAMGLLDEEGEPTFADHGAVCAIADTVSDKVRVAALSQKETDQPGEESGS
jgi:hypothetical protein